METMEILFLIGVLMLVFSISTAFAGAKMTGDFVKKDDDKEEALVEGTVMEKTADVYNAASVKKPYEWIIFMDQNGVRRKYRNLQTNEIILVPGDKGMLAVRGETIYGFFHEKPE